MSPMKEDRKRAEKLKEFGRKVEDKVKKGIDKLEGLLKDDLLAKEGPLDRGLDRIETLLKEPIFKKKAGAKKDDSSPFEYLEIFMRDQVVATVHPSSKYIIRKVMKGLHLEGVKVVVEYGPADGVITRHILDELPKDAVLVAIERNGDFFKRLVETVKDKRLRPVHGDVRDVDAILDKLGVGKADRMVSGIPFSFLTADERERLLHSTAKRLNPDGRFIAYQVTTHLIPLLKRHFSDVDVKFEIRNFPPHFVFTAYK